ncbi:MAG TPA: hypothetical protein VKQ30_22205 [Ktedonobacterales bacterium]|nr:hypothetical protein [Ktedonobacterales bacterium]
MTHFQAERMKRVSVGARGVPRLTHFADLGFSLIESPLAAGATLYQHQTARVFTISDVLADLVRQAGMGVSRAYLEAECQTAVADPRQIERTLRENLLDRPSQKRTSTTTPMFSTLIQTAPPPVYTLSLGHPRQQQARQIHALGELVRRSGALQGVVRVEVPVHSPADPDAWVVELRSLRDVVDEAQITTDADVRVVLRAHAALCPDLSPAADAVDHLSAEVTEHDDYVPVADLGLGWKSVSMRMRSAPVEVLPDLLRAWRDEGARFFEIPLPLATAIYPVLHDELLPTAERPAVLVHHYSVLFARLLGRASFHAEQPESTACYGGSHACWARALCPDYPGGGEHCVTRRRLAALAIADFDMIVAQLKRSIYRFAQGERLQHVLDFVAALSDAIVLGWPVAHGD